MHHPVVKCSIPVRSGLWLNIKTIWKFLPRPKLSVRCLCLLCLGVYNTSLCQVSFFWQINTSSTTVLFLNLTVGAPCSPWLLVWLCCLYHVTAPFPYPSCQRNQTHLSPWEIRCAKRGLSVQCGLIWIIKKNKETQEGQKPYCIIYYDLLPMGAYTPAHIHKWMSSLLCMCTMSN